MESNSTCFNDANPQKYHVFMSTFGVGISQAMLTCPQIVLTDSEQRQIDFDSAFSYECVDCSYGHIDLAQIG